MFNAWDYESQRRKRDERIVELTARWLEREPDWTVTMARVAAEHEDAVIHGSDFGPPPRGLLSYRDRR